jgi:peptidoglycan/xylan/chitin deacetylase (PgdA/CDA1 family)
VIPSLRTAGDKVYGLARRARRLLPTTPSPAILMYHRVAEESFDPWGLAVSPVHFAAHVRWISRRRTPLSLTEFAKRHSDGTLPEDAIAVTFDDGYACTAQVAAPLLESMSVPATIFIPPELIERGRPFWWDELEALALGYTADRLELNGIVFDLGPRSAAARNWKPGAEPQTPRQGAFLRLWKHLQQKPPGELDRSVGALRDLFNAPTTQQKRPMTVDEVRSTASDTIAFGSHALTHPSLPNLQRSQKRSEIRDSLDRCRQLSGAVPKAFAYPFGEFDPESEQLAEEAGYACACTADHRWATPESRAFALPRLTVSNRGARILERIVNFAPG